MVEQTKVRYFFALKTKFETQHFLCDLFKNCNREEK